jgi:hypothetical protein
MRIENPQKMTLNIINDKLINCKISTYEMTSADLEQALRDILFNPQLNLKTTLFQGCQNDEVSLKIFLKKTHNKTIYSDNILTGLFHKMSNKKDTLKYNDFMSYYSNPIYADKNVNTNLTERFFEQS